MNFYNLNRKRKYFAEDHKELDHFVKVSKTSMVLVSAPHAVSQVRLGKIKVPEIGSLKSVLWINDSTDVNLIVKTKNNYDDANLDETSLYKDDVFSIIENNNIKYVFDFHGLGSHRPYDINLGTNMGRNIAVDVKLFDDLVKALKSKGIVVSVDYPFNAGNHTISGSTKIKYNNLWTLQVEINTSLSNKSENFNKYKDIISVFIDFIEKLNKRK